MILTATSTVVVAIAGSTLAQAAETKVALKRREHRGIIIMPPIRTLSLDLIIKWQKALIKHDQWVVRTAKSHKPRIVRFHKEQLIWTTKSLRKSLTQWQSQYHVTWPSRSLPWPAHHNLWMCIHSHEAADWHNRDTGGNGHYGGLQMHPGWGYGTSYYASDSSQSVQEFAAEAGYKASGYSHTWLMGQWNHPDCLSYA